MCLSSQQKADHSSSKIPFPPPFSFPLSPAQVGSEQGCVYCTCAINALWLQNETPRCAALGKSRLVTGDGLCSSRATRPWNGTFPWDQRLNMLRSIRAMKVPLLSNREANM